MSLSGAAMLTRSATSVYEAHKAGDKKECNRRLLIGLGSAVAFAGGIWARDMLGKWLGEGKEDTHTEPNPENAGAQNGNGDEGAAVSLAMTIKMSIIMHRITKRPMPSFSMMISIMVPKLRPEARRALSVC